MQIVNLAIPTDILYEVNAVNQRGMSQVEKLKQSLAIGMLVCGEISFAKAAELAGQTLVQFMDTLSRIGVPIINYTEDMFADDMQFANEA